MLSMLRPATTQLAAKGSMLRAAGIVRSHCQVPCGIFDDPVRVALLKEDAATVRKAMVQINELAEKPADALALNQVHFTYHLTIILPRFKPILQTPRLLDGS